MAFVIIAVICLPVLAILLCRSILREATKYLFLNGHTRWYYASKRLVRDLDSKPTRNRFVSRDRREGSEVDND